MNDIIQKYLTKHDFGMFSPKTVLFDMDGVLYDSMKNHAKAWNLSMAHYGLDLSIREAYGFEGMRGFETIKIVARRQWGREISDEESEEMYALKSAIYAEQPTADLIPGVHHLQEKLKEYGMKIGVVTGSGQHSLLERILRDFDGLVSPDVMVTALNIKRGKPAPDPYLMGMKMAGAKPWETIVVENAPLGVRAAVAAQCFTVAVNTGPLDDADLLNEGCDLLFHSMDEFTAVLPSLLLASEK